MQRQDALLARGARTARATRGTYIGNRRSSNKIPSPPLAGERVGVRGSWQSEKMHMKTEEKFLQDAKRTLDATGQNLDLGTLARLRAARRAAIEQGMHKPARARPGWLLPAGGFATAGIALAVAGLLWFSAPNGNLMQASISDIELLTAHENPDFFTEIGRA